MAYIVVAYPVMAHMVMAAIGQRPHRRLLSLLHARRRLVARSEAEDVGEVGAYMVMALYSYGPT